MELLVVVVIISLLAGLLVAGGMVVQNRARTARTNATLESLCVGCERYWDAHYDYPSTDPEEVGLKQVLEDNNQDEMYWDTANSEWTDLARNVAVVFQLSRDRRPEPFVDVSGMGFEPTKQRITGPGDRELYYAVDGSGTPLKFEVGRPDDEEDYKEAYMDLISAGPDERFESEGTVDYTEDNIRKRVRQMK
jgi:Tfp pilus assembly protein PilE